MSTHSSTLQFQLCDTARPGLQSQGTHHLIVIRLSCSVLWFYLHGRDWRHQWPETPCLVSCRIWQINVVKHKKNCILILFLLILWRSWLQHLLWWCGSDISVSSQMLDVDTAGLLGKDDGEKHENTTNMFKGGSKNKNCSFSHNQNLYGKINNL